MTENRVLVCWPGFGESRLEEKEEWLETNHGLIERTKADYIVDYLIFSYHSKPIRAPQGITVKYRKGIVFQYMYQELIPAELAKQYSYIFFVMDDINLHPSFCLTEYIDIYRRNNLDILQCSLDTRTILRHIYMRTSPGNKVGRLTNIAEFFCYLMSIPAYDKYYHTFLGPDVYWGWGLDLNLWHVGKLRVGLLDKYPIWHRINGACRATTSQDPWTEMKKWQRIPYECFGELE